MPACWNSSLPGFQPLSGTSPHSLRLHHTLWDFTTLSGTSPHSLGLHHSMRWAFLTRYHLIIVTTFASSKVNFFAGIFFRYYIDHSQTVIHPCLDFIYSCNSISLNRFFNFTQSLLPWSFLMTFSTGPDKMRVGSDLRAYFWLVGSSPVRIWYVSDKMRVGPKSKILNIRMDIADLLRARWTPRICCGPVGYICGSTAGPYVGYCGSAAGPLDIYGFIRGSTAGWYFGYCGSTAGPLDTADLLQARWIYAECGFTAGPYTLATADLLRARTLDTADLLRARWIYTRIYCGLVLWILRIYCGPVVDPPDPAGPHQIREPVVDPLYPTGPQ